MEPVPWTRDIGLGCREPSPLPSPLMLSALGGISQPICGVRVWGVRRQWQEARQELWLGVGRGLFCWELSSGSHQQGGREGAAFPGPHTLAGPIGTQPTGLQPPLPA